jgi:hypothetical protein
MTHDCDWEAGRQYAGPVALLRRVASAYGDDSDWEWSAQTYYDGAICRMLADALDAGDIVAEAEVRCFAFALPDYKRPERIKE